MTRPDQRSPTAPLFKAAINGRTTVMESSLLKHLVTESSIRAVDEALESTGNPGLARHKPLERQHRNVSAAASTRPRWTWY